MVISDSGLFVEFFILFGSLLFFLTRDTIFTDQLKLWVSDGTEAGTRRVSIATENGFSYPGPSETAATKESQEQSKIAKDVRLSIFFVFLL